MAKNVNRNRTSSAKSKPTSTGRTAQRNRTRKAIVDATMQLVIAGGTPSMAEICESAQVSRRTIYMYFPTIEHLLLDATIGALSANTIDPVVASPASNDPVVRVEQLSRSINRNAAQTMHLGRALIRLTVEGDEPQAGGPRRGYRRIQWIEQALAPAREKLHRPQVERLVSALSVLIGWEPLIVLKDVRGLDPADAEDVLAFAVRAVIEKALAEAPPRGTRRRLP